MNGETGKIPDEPLTALAFRVWAYHPRTARLFSLNMPPPQAGWIAAAFADPAGGWPADSPLEAACPFLQRNPDNADEHGPVPSKGCTCGIYATTSLDVVNAYLRPDSPVLGVVELGGSVRRARQGYRAQYARVAAILLIDRALTVGHGTLKDIAVAYRVPALVPHSARAGDYRDRLRAESSVGDEAEKWLHAQMAEEDDDE